MITAVLGLLFHAPFATAPERHALRAHPEYPHYFQSAAGKPVLLVGDYTWGTFSEVDYDYEAMFDTLKANGLNFARVWVYWGNETGFEDQTPPEHYHRVNIVPYLRTGPGMANDGQPRFDLTQFNEAFFARLQAVCAAARRRGLYLQLTLFDAWMIKHPHLWRLHAYQRDNNVNGVDGDPDDTGRGTDNQRGFCSMGNGTALQYQKAFVRHAVEAVNGVDNVLFEIANENYYSSRWERLLAEYIHEVEATLPRQHLVMTLDLPNHDYGGIKTWDLPQLHAALLNARSLNQPLIFDTDGLGNPDDDTVRRAAWTAFCSGGHVSYLDDSLQPGHEAGGDFQGSRRASLRRQLGHLAAFARRVPSWEMQPADTVVKSGAAYVLASDREWVAYLPAGEATLDLTRFTGPVTFRWYDPRTGALQPPGRMVGGQEQRFSPAEGDWVLWLKGRP